MAFLENFSPFSQARASFIGDMMFGIMAEKDVKLSSIVRALKEKITPKKVEDRLSRMLSSSELVTSLFLSRRATRGAFAQQKSLEGVSPERSESAKRMR